MNGSLILSPSASAAVRGGGFKSTRTRHAPGMRRAASRLAVRRALVDHLADAGQRHRLTRHPSGEPPDEGEGGAAHFL